MDTTDASARPPFFAGYQSRGARFFGVVFTGVWLLYLVAGVADLFHHHYSAAYIAGGLAIILVFSVLYLVLVPTWPWPRRYTQPGLAVLAGIAVVGCLFYGPSGIVALWIFMSSACGLLVANRRWAVRAVLGCIACYVIFSFTTHVGNGQFLGNLLPVVFIGFAMIGLRGRMELTAELARARAEVVQLATSEERLRLARDMHDLTGQSLSMITLKSELAARLLGRLPASADRDRAREEVEQVAAVSRQTLRDIREAISGYRRPTLAVEVITARATLASAGIAAKDDAALTLLSGSFDPDTEAALAWCLREAVTNVVRHSGATTCHMGLVRRGKRLVLAVRDDGRGHAGGSATQGSGLHGMSERLDAVGGSLQIRPDARPGFSLVVTVPWRADTVRPDTGRPDTVRPDTGRPDTGRPDDGTARPDGALFDQAGLELR
jgi:two-component system, NarL family, sensor histidine kinase DesK